MTPRHPKIAIAILFAVSVCAGAAELAEYQIKAEFIERFTRFVEWPAGAFESPADPFVIGVIGRDPFGSYLDLLSRQRTILGRSVEVRRLGSLEAVGSCHILFVASSERRRIAEIAERAKGSPVLTIADTPGAIDAGVMINLYTAESRIRFEINEARLEEAGFRASAQLLKLARAGAPGGVR